MKNLYYIILLGAITFLNAQTSSFEIDSLKNKSYEELTNEFKEARKNQDTILGKKLADFYIKKGRKEKNTIEEAYGYALYSKILDYETALSYADTVIILTKDSEDRSFPTLGFLLKGRSYFKLGNYKRSLENFLEANYFAEKKGHIDHQIGAKEGIAIIRKNWGNYKEAIKIYRDILPEIKGKSKFYKDYLNILHNLSIAYLVNNQLDSAFLFTKLGIEKSLELKDSSRYYNFVFTNGTVLYSKKNISEALDSIDKSLPYLKDYNIPFGYFYKAKILIDNNDEIKGIKYLLKVDSIYKVNNDEFSELLETYSLLSSFYKKKKDKQKQLLFLEKLVKIDSILNKNYEYIDVKIQKSYDIPILKKEKEILIDQIQNERENSKLYKFILFGLGVLSLIIINWYYQKQRKYKQKFENLVSENLEKKEVKEKLKGNEKKVLPVPDEIVLAIMEQIHVFEQNKGFLQRDITLQSLANDFKTNSSYLSKVINHFKNKNFAAYLNELRINESVKRLKEDKQFRKYTIQAIAHESGFKSSQSFSRAFYRQTGIYPSYFLKELEKSQ